MRKDLAVTGIVGKPKVGYETALVIEAIESFLGWDNANHAFVIGAGSLGTAFLGFERFSEYGLKVLAAFDIDDAKIGSKIHDKDVFHLERLPGLVKRLHVRIALLTVPTAAAQEVASYLINSGIKAILNFTPAKLELSSDCIVEDVNIAASLAALSSRLSQRMKLEREVK